MTINKNLSTIPPPAPLGSPINRTWSTSILLDSIYFTHTRQVPKSIKIVENYFMRDFVSQKNNQQFEGKYNSQRRMTCCYHVSG